jgi:hypothetical protein
MAAFGGQVAPASQGLDGRHEDTSFTDQFIETRCGLVVKRRNRNVAAAFRRPRPAGRGRTAPAPGVRGCKGLVPDSVKPNEKILIVPSQRDK